MKRQMLMSWHTRESTARTIAARLQETVKRVPGANPHRRYVVERGPFNLGWRIVKHT